jgi:hypothetical protein
VIGHVGQEVLGGEALALKAALHVGQREQHGVDRAGGGLGPEFVECHGG